MNYDQNKKPLFDLCLQKWKENKGKGITVLPTGVGKTVLGIYLAEKFLPQQIENKRGRTIILTNNQVLVKQWIVSLEKFLNKPYLELSKYIKVFTPDTYSEDKEDVINKCNLLIIDEIHNYTTKNKVKFLNKEKINYDFIFGLTGSLNDSNKTVICQYLPITYELSIQEAIDKNYIPNLIEYNYGIELEGNYKEIYDKYNSIIEKGLQKYRSYNVIRDCVIGRKDFIMDIPAEVIRDEIAKNMMFDKDMICDNDLKKSIFAEWNPDKIKEETSKIFAIYRQRSDIIDNHVVKTQIALELYKRLKLKTIFFCKSTSNADYVKSVLKDECALYHSKIKTTNMTDENGNIILQKNGEPKKFGLTYFKKDAIEGLKSGKYNCLSTVMALNEGLDVSNLKLAIITAGTHNSNQQIQRKGRVLRFEDYLKKSENEKSFVVNIFIKNTRDEDKLILRQSKSDNYIKFVENFEDLIINIKNNL